jgi:hypothetical protein
LWPTTRKGTEDTALEIDRVGKDGLKTTGGTINDIDRGGKKLVVKPTMASSRPYWMTDYAAKDGGKDTGEGMEKGAKVTVHYTEDAGKNVAHFFDKT